MFSVTQRFKTVSQPINGYVPCSLFKENIYEDYNDVFEIGSNLTQIQGLAVDYLTRFMLTNDKMTAFDISIKGAKKVDEVYETNSETDKIMTLLTQINGLDRQSVIAACEIVCYDSAFRMGVKAFRNIDTIELSNELIHNIPILVNRTLTFLDNIGGIISSEMTFEGGYTTTVSSGDGDYLSCDTIIDLKVSKNDLSIKWTLQLLMYYLLGIHSVHKEYENMRYLCIFNPLKNKSYVCDILQISDESKYEVSHEVLGYKMTYSSLQFDKNWNEYFDYSRWKEVEGSDNNVLKSILTKKFVKTDFNISNYENGIYDITVDDYWTFLQTTEDFQCKLRPIFKNTKSIKFIMRNGYFMFVSVSSKDRYSLLQGARLHSLKYSLEYYYDFLEQYANGIIGRFSKYWDTLRDVSDQIKSLEPTEKYLRQQYSEYLSIQKSLGVPKSEILSYDCWYSERGCNYRLSGRIHGCIIDLDWSNHIYINPLDGKVTPYFASSMYDKDIYTNTRSLLSAHIPAMLPSFDKLLKENNTSLVLADNQNHGLSIVSNNEDINTDFIKVYDYDMYAVSNRLKPLQAIYDFHWVQIWYDDILCHKGQIEDKKYLQVKNTQSKKKSSQDYVGQSFIQKNGLSVTVLRYGGYKDVDVLFEDGTLVEHVRMISVEIGNIKHPVINKPVPKEHIEAPAVKDKYIGMEKMMNCGLKAVCIDYIDCKHITIQFSDGMIRENIRSDHFYNGKVKHEGGYYK